ncbi:MAG TPA: low affinity iron permease family protein [Flavisolibacter sp.]|jgi:low affinity Fe/Cu permease|nr:low affinity iron permease family protein [Flavisolibacter sp.]
MDRKTSLEKHIDQELNKGNDANKANSKRGKGFKAWFERMAANITKVTGSSSAFVLALAVILIWAITGPVFHFSDTWQLVINTGTTIITFLMVFIIQQSQNKDSLAIQLKLNELIACDERASNRLIVVEDLTQEELEVLKKFYIKLSTLARDANDLHSSHSVDEADDIHEYKRSHHKRVSIQKKITE